MDALELVYDYFEDRPHAAALIRQRRPLALGVLGALIGATSLFVADALAGRLSLLPFSLPSLALTLMWQLVALFAVTAVMHLLLDMTGARGDAGALFVHLGLSELAWIAAAPVVILLQLLPDPTWPTRAAFWAIGFWSLALKARGLRDEYGVGEGRAWLTLGLPYLVLASLLAVSALLALFAALLKAFA